MLWLTDRRGRRSACPPTRSRTSRSAARTPASGASGFGCLVSTTPPRPPAAVRHRQGRGRQDDDRRRARAARVPQQGKRTLVCEVDAKGNLADFFEVGRTAFEPREVQPGLFAMSMDTEESLQGVPAGSSSSCRCVARIGPLARRLRLRRHRRPGREGDPHRRQVRAGRCASATTTSSSSTRRRPATSSVSSPRRRRSTSSSRSASSASRRGWMHRHPRRSRARPVS